MVYSTSRCPHCNNIVNRQTNPTKELANPFEKCPWCGKFYKNSYKNEWLTMSPAKRFFYYIQTGVWARGFLVSMLIGFLFSNTTTGDTSSLFTIIWLTGFLIYMVIGWFVHRNASQTDVRQSLKRTRSYEYVELLRSAGYRVYPIKGVKYGYLKEKNNESVEEIDNEEDDENADDLVEKIDSNNINDSDVSDVATKNDELSAKVLFEKAEELRKNGNIDSAIEQYQKSSDMKCHEASLSLGYIYLNGQDGVRKNKVRALKYFKKAKEYGNQFAVNIIKEMEENDK